MQNIRRIITAAFGIFFYGLAVLVTVMADAEARLMALVAELVLAVLGVSAIASAVGASAPGCRASGRCPKPCRHG